MSECERFDARLSRITPKTLEFACIDDWRAEHKEYQSGWMQFASKGASLRINSVWPLEWEEDGSSFEATYERCASFAQRHSIPLIFKIADGAFEPPTLIGRLEKLGFSPSHETLVMTRDLAGVAAPEREIAWATELHEPFVEVLRSAATTEADFEERHSVIQRMSDWTIFPTTFYNGVPQAIGLGRHSGAVVGLYLMRTRADARRQGHARDIVRTICAWGHFHGAALAFLQVEEENNAAVALYESEGFATFYRYRYWKQR